MPSKEEIRQNVTKWIEALRSGDYEQGRSLLCQGRLYCCLGVGVETLHGHDIWIGGISGGIMYYGLFQIETLSDEDMASLGLTMHDQSELTSMNDEKRLTFPEIAEWIEINALSRLGREDLRAAA